MKTQLFFLLLLTGLATACNQGPEGQKVEAEATREAAISPADGTIYQVDPQASSVNWTASKVTGEHNGTIQISEGTLSVKDGAIQGGSFTLDMSSITVLDLQGEQKAKLENHLRSGDFFQADQYPTGSFEITSANPVDGNAEVTHNITGNLTLKGISKSVTIPANIIIAGNRISAITPNFTINRTEWDINYRSGIIGTAADKIINDEIGLVINLQATK